MRMKTIEMRRRLSLTPAQVLDRVADEETWAGDGASVTVHSGRADGIRITTSAAIPRASLPPMAERFVDPDARIVQRVTADPTADDARAAQLRIAAEVPGAPVDVSVVVDLAAASAGTDLHAVTRVRSSMPLLGSAVESAVGPFVESMLTRSFDKIADL